MENPFKGLLMPHEVSEGIANSFVRGSELARQRAEDQRKRQARDAAGTILAEGPTANALAVYGQPAPSSAGTNALLGVGQAAADPAASAASPVAEAWRTLARTDPQLFGQLRQMDNEQRKFVGERLQRNLELGGRAMGSILAVPEADRGAVWSEQVRPYLTAQGVEGLPEAWDENFARTQLRLSATAAQALGHDISQHRLEWDIEDDKVDNARADLNTQSLIDAREEGLAISRRGQDIASRDRRRGQDISDRRARDLHGRRVRGKPVTPNEGIIQMPDGRKGVVRNGKWVDAATGKAL